jgi:integrase
MRTKRRAGSVKRSEWVVTPFIGAMLDRYCLGRGNEEPIFERTGKNVNSFRSAFVEAVKFGEILVETVNEQGMKEMVRPQFRDLRHVAACNMLDSGLTVDEVAVILGHRSTAMVTRVYNNRQKVSTRQRQADLIALGMERILGPQTPALVPALVDGE